jgi:hypothetical protein
LNNLLNVCIFVNLPVSVGFHKYCQYIRNRALVTKEKFI